MKEITDNIKRYDFGNGDTLRVQSVTLPDWASLDFANPAPSEESFAQVCDLYEKFILPKAPYLFGTLIFFYLPEDVDIPFPFNTRFGEVADRETAAAIGLSKYIKRGKFLPDDTATKFIDDLKNKGFFRIIRGTRPLHAKVLCVSNKMGLLSSLKDACSIISNAGFFTMDMFDIGSPYDIIGRPIGLCVKDGICINPPFFKREALLARQDGTVTIEQPEISDMEIEINGKLYKPGKNSKVFERPRLRWSDSGGINLAIIGNRVAAILKNKRMIIPSAGFVLQLPGTDASAVKAGDTVIYRGFEDVIFGIQAGNSAVKSGEEIKNFISYFSNIRNPIKLPIPPSLYPLDYEKARAPRMAIGNDSNGRPVLLWAEGPGKFDDLSVKGDWSCGASLSEMAYICKDLGLVDAVNLDGGGSAQIILNGKRSLLISDRHKEDNSEYERSVPIGISISFDCDYL